MSGAVKEVDLDGLMCPPPEEDVSDLLMEIIDTVENAKGVKGKQDVLRDAAKEIREENSWLLMQVLKYAYDGSIRFGIAAKNIDIPVTVPAHPVDFGAWVFTMLDMVIAESSTTRKKELIEEHMGNLSPNGRTLLFRIIDKDLRCGISESTINKAFSSLLSTFDVMLAKPFAARHAAWPSLVEPKLDGLRVIAEVDTAAKTVAFYTRSGKPIESLNNFKTELLAFAYQIIEQRHGDQPGTVAFDGEVTSGTFLESMSQVRKSSEQVQDGTYHVFDVLTRGPGRSPIALTDAELEEQGTQRERRQRLMKGFLAFKKHVPEPKFVRLTESYMASSEDEVMAIYERCRDANLEGVIVKDPSAFYVKKRSAAWLKIKAEETLDLPIIGAFEGTGQFAGSLGGFIVSNDGVEVRVGSGFKPEQRAEYWAAIQEDLRHIENGNRAKCQLIDCPAEVQFQEKLPSGSLRHPVFVRLRRDKQLGAVGAF